MTYTNKAINIVPTLDELRNMRIMVVDDIPTNIILIKAMLEHGGFTNLVSASNGQKALEYLQNNPPGSEGAIDVLLLDIIMPAMDGFTLCRHLRNEPRWTDVPIIMVTSEDKWREETARASFDAGAIDIMFKPVRSNELLPRIISALSLKRERDIRLQDAISLQKKIREMQFTEARFNYVSEHDEITGVFTRGKLLRDIATHIGSRQPGDDSCLIKIKISNYPDIRKQHNHQQVVKFTQSLVVRIHAVCGQSGRLYTLSDDSFAMLIHTDSREQARQIITSIAGITEVSYSDAVDAIHPGLVIGSAFINDFHIATQHDLLTLAEIACDQALRQASANIYEIRTADIENTVFANMPYEQDDNSIRTRLLRGTHRHSPDMYLVTPATDSVFRTIEDLQHSVTASQNYSLLDHRVVISASAKLFLDEESIAKLKYTISANYLEPATYVFMLDEADLHLNMNQLRHYLNDLTKDGFVFGLQGIGGIYTSDSHLQELPVNYALLELSCSPATMNSTRTIDYCKAIVDKAHTNGCQVIAECHEDVSVLNNLQIDYLIAETEVINTPHQVV